MRSRPEISVIIPAYNGGWVLHRALEALRAQDADPARYEVIIVDDGSTDGSADGLEAEGPGPPVRVLRQPNRGRAAARNRGAAEAQGRVMLFLDADVWAAPGLVSAHLAHHAGRANLGVQGRSITHPDSLTTMYMRARNLVPDVTIRKREGLSPYHVITQNFSVDADAFRRASGFDEGFGGYGWEDIELAFRLARQGVTLRYESEAITYHYHIQTLEETREKLRQAGEGAVYFWEKHDRNLHLGTFLEILPVLLPLKWLVYRSGLVTAPLMPILWIAERTGLTLVCNEIYSHLQWRSFYQGVFDARRRRR